MNCHRFYTFLCVLTTINFTLAVFLSNYFRLLDPDVVILGEPIAEGNRFEHPLKCLIECPITVGCKAISYNFAEKTCFSYNWSEIALGKTISVPQSASVVNTRILMFHVTGNSLLTFVEARNYCQEFGGELATVSDLYNARDSGYDLCRCGWISDESIRFVIQTQRPDCDSYDVGVISCKDLTSSTDAYCKFV